MVIKIHYKIWLILIACSLSAYVGLHAFNIQFVDRRLTSRPIKITLIDAAGKTVTYSDWPENNLLKIDDDASYKKMRIETANPIKRIRVSQEFELTPGKSYTVSVLPGSEITAEPYTPWDTDFGPDYEAY